MVEVAQHLKGRDFTRIGTWNSDELKTALDLADGLKALRKEREPHALLPGRTLGMIFQKPSTRTRVSFEVGIVELGGYGLYLSANDLQLGRGETIKDTGHVLERYLDAIVIRTFAQEDVEELADHADIPVINGLTDYSHPCQALADLMTIRERLGRLSGARLAYLGDGNNVCVSLMVGAARFGMRFVAATPRGYEPDPNAVSPLHGRLDEHGPGERVRPAAQGPRRLPDRRRAALAREPGRDRAPLPAGALWGGDHRGGSIRAALGRLGRGREPPARPEGSAGADRLLAVVPA